MFKKTMSHWHDDAMIKIERISWILSPAFAVLREGTEIPGDDPKLHVYGEDHSENWHVQVDTSVLCTLNIFHEYVTSLLTLIVILILQIFRSIDSGSVQGFPKRIDVAQAQARKS